MTTSNADQASEGSYVQSRPPLHHQTTAPWTGDGGCSRSASQQNHVSLAPVSNCSRSLPHPADIKPSNVTKPALTPRLCRTEQGTQNKAPSRFALFDLTLSGACQVRAPAQWAGYNSLLRLQDTTASNSTPWSRPFHRGLKPHRGCV